MIPRRKQIPRNWIRVALLLSAALLFSPTLASAEVIWRGDFETGTTEQWRGAPKSASVKVVTEPVRAGKYALMFCKISGGAG